MGAKAGVGLKFLQWFIRGIQFLCAALILAVYSYFLATLHNHDLRIGTSVRAVEGISGAAVVYTLFALVLLCCVAGLAFFSFIAMVLDVAFIGAFIYVATANKGGASSCTGYLNTPFGDGNSDETNDSGSGGFTALPNYRTACKLQSACLAVSIVAIFFFVFSILTELFLARHHRKEKRFGPSPANNYTSGYGNNKIVDGPVDETTKPGFFGRFRNRKHNAVPPAENNALPQHTTPAELDNRPTSYNTDTTAVGNDRFDNNKLETGYGYPNQTQNGITNAEAAPGRVYGGRPTTAGSYNPPNNYRYDDGIY